MPLTHNIIHLAKLLIMYMRDIFMEITLLLIPRKQKTKDTWGYFVNELT